MTALPALGRLLWMLLGPMFLFMLAARIAETGNGWFTPADFAFLGVLAFVVLGRWLEFRFGKPETAAGEPATWGHFQRFVGGAVLIGLGVWVVANLIGNR